MNEWSLRPRHYKILEDSRILVLIKVIVYLDFSQLTRVPVEVDADEYKHFTWSVWLAKAVGFAIDIFMMFGTPTGPFELSYLIRDPNVLNVSFALALKKLALSTSVVTLSSLWLIEKTVKDRQLTDGNTSTNPPRQAPLNLEDWPALQLSPMPRTSTESGTWYRYGITWSLESSVNVFILTGFKTIYFLIVGNS